MANFLKALFGNYSKREVKRVQPIADKVLALESKYAAMSESELKSQTAVLKERLANGETTDQILPDAFAACREASWRVLGMKHFPVQVIGGIVLHQGRIAEMKTGEGKTLVATLPAYLNALTGNGVHIVTVNDYLARRDSEWMGKLYKYMGLKVGLIVHDLENNARKEAYNADITYGTNNELGFDYLRDNMVVYKENKVQRGHAFAIVDEVDSILIDEARTPLIISGQGDKSTDLYERADRLAKTLKLERFTEIDSKEDMDEYYAANHIDYVVDEKQKTATLTQLGVKKAEEFFGIENLTDPDNLTIQHHVNQAIKANGVMKLDVDYVVKDGEVIIVDEFTGRLMYGRRFNEGLHQAIEAKEGVKVQSESKTLATITFQNYFRLYNKLSGMTGTGQTESEEFQEIYKLDVVEIPTNKPVIRKDLPDSVFKTENGKFNAVIDQIAEVHEKGQPVLVGTISIEKSEHLSKMLKRRGIKHNVLNAKQHDKEAEIIAQAGKFGAVTIATNMAGRGTDIILGGNAEYMADGLVLTDSMAHSLLSEGPARMNFIIMALCKKGQATYSLDTRKQEVKVGDLMFISEGHVVSAYEATPDFKCLYIMLSTEFYHSFVMNVKNVSSLLLFSMNNPVVPLTTHEIQVYTNYYMIIRQKMADQAHHFRTNLVKALLLAMFYDMSNVIWRVGQSEDIKTRKRADSMFTEFIALLEENVRTERRVSWYAEQIGITPKYLSEMVKQVSKRTPNEWIDNYVMLEIRVLLKNTTKSIKEIADAVNFPNQSFLGKFFKEHMGMSPSEFRKS